MQRHMWEDTEVNFLEEVNLVKVQPLAILGRKNDLVGETRIYFIPFLVI